MEINSYCRNVEHYWAYLVHVLTLEKGEKDILHLPRHISVKGIKINLFDNICNFKDNII